MKQIALILTILLALLLSACGSGQAAATQPAGVQGAAQETPGSQERQPGEMPKAMKLAIGTLKLEGTPNAVTAEQSKELLPLWKAVRSLTNSSNAAQKEVDGLFNQIEKAMTAEQLLAIDTMDINMETLASLSKELGLELGGGPQGTPNPEVQATMQAVRQTAVAGGQPEGQGGGFGGPPPGGMGGGPGMGGPVGSDSGLSEEARATAMAQRGPAGARTGVSPALLEAIIKLLESK